MPRRPRCSCGDLFSEHDWHSQNTRVCDPCRGPVCAALMRAPHREDPCETYSQEGYEYVPLRQILPAYGLTPADVGLTAEHPKKAAYCRRGLHLRCLGLMPDRSACECACHAPDREGAHD